MAPTQATQPRVITREDELRAYLRSAREDGARLGLVPTMGALHEGHVSLVRRARRECDRVVVTIFVNPTQFGPHEDFQKYPRTLPTDLLLLAPEGVDVVFAPTADVMYPPGFSTYVEPPAVSQPWEGQCRPGHFRGVATVVLKLFLLVPADCAYFGRKDYQQCLVVRRMATDLNLPIEIRLCPTVREPDGLALSSRNRYLSSDERQRAGAISRGMRAARELFLAGERNAERLRTRVLQELADAEIRPIDYVAIVDPESLAELTSVNSSAVILVAARVGSTRLIDNLAFDEAVEDH